MPSVDVRRERRKGVPQFQQPHVLLARGLQELERLFPGLEQRLLSLGAVRIDVPQNFAAYDERFGRWVGRQKAEGEQQMYMVQVCA